jgi:hypothetical protein
MALESIRNSYRGEHIAIALRTRGHFELVCAVLDPVSPCDPVKIGIGSPDLAFIVLVDEKPYRPVESGIGVCSNELRAERRIPEDPAE